MENVKYFCLVALLISTITMAVDQSLLILGPYGTISDRNTREDLGIVKHVRSCGGSAKVVQWRYESCVDSDPICQIPSSSLSDDGKLMTGQVDFILSNVIKSPAVRFVLRTDDNVTHIVDNPSSISTDGILEIGNMYTITLFGNTTKELAGKLGVLQISLYDMSSSHVEFCAETDLKFV